mgnify:FL=1
MITKTAFVNGCRCMEYLWLSQNKPAVLEHKDTAHTRDGDEVGETARKYYAGAVTVKKNRLTEMAKETAALMRGGVTTICEASFVADDLACAADIVRVFDDGLDIIEVKSSTSIKNVQVDDIAFQCHVIEKAGFHVRNAYLMHLNKDYIRHGELNLQELFKQVNITDEVRKREASIAAEIAAMRLAENSEEPNIPLSCSCDSPYECPCKTYCFHKAGVPEKSIFTLHGVTAKKKYAYFNMGIKTVDALLTYASESLTERQMKLVKLETSSIEDDLVVEKPKVKEFLDSLPYPLYLLDFETTERAIPAYDGEHPYQHVPFQYSLHIMTGPNEEVIHKEFLADERTDPKRDMVQHLCADIPEGAIAMAYNFSFEKNVLRMLSEEVPEAAHHLMAIHNRMIDLMVPFKDRLVYRPSMCGSYSIKAVLPALCGDDKSLDYHALPVVHNGGEAMEVFANLRNITDREEVQRIREGMLMYCGLDTLAMVKIIQKLYELVK